MRRRTTICREGWFYLLVVALAFGGAMLREVNLLLVLSGLLLGPLLFHWRAVVLSLRGLDVRRRLPQQVCAGDLLVGSVTLSNTRLRVGSWAVVVEDQIAPEAAVREKPVRPGVLFPFVAPGVSCQGAYRGRLARRGRYRVGPLRISTQFPFGLVRRTVTLRETETLTVFPRLGRLARRWAARRREAFAGTRQREERHGTEGDFYGLRPWRSGDSRRWIHWRSSARARTLLVRQFEQPRNRDVAVVLDLWQPPRPTPREIERVELAVSFAATLLTDLCRTGGSTLHLVAAEAREAAKRDVGDTHGRDARATSGSASGAVLHEMMERLALVEAYSDDRLAELLDSAARQVGPRAEIVLVSTRPIDLDDSSRFVSLGNIRCVDTSSEELWNYFEFDKRPPPSGPVPVER